MSSNKWSRVEIQTKEGKVEGVAPVIITASRSTDIPAFYSEWFFNRLEEGYIKWINPFNGKPQYVSFDKSRLIVFWTKDAGPIIKHLDRLQERNINYYFTFTLNDYENEGFEPGLRSLKERIETFKLLSKKIGKENIIWRFDPLILTDKIDVDLLLNKIKEVGDELNSYTDKLVISFVDITKYRKVRNNFRANNIFYEEFATEKKHKIAEGLQKINEGWKLEIATCSEEVDLTEYGIKKNKCIDDELIMRNFAQDNELLDFLGKGYHKLKDKGQRNICGCIISKDIGQYDTCKHQCIYCYANISPKVALDNYKKYLKSNKNNEAILF
ncbi:DUF1848 domain-containing protein [Natranaerofaba carboxydovora]|uniref:DUF1848 domain-containing protein n=1 Tax=Natranaerofaba carboxydovora TaxID=2742683 RepID=UPI001F12C28B|nr:DUF1848 domain-containing protein [Natranaerofaba carboxydovora]UMZ73680.1 hypothetical protein ACONDI_01243 [Natranaerofaba carboxydovora]